MMPVLVQYDQPRCSGMREEAHISFSFENSGLLCVKKWEELMVVLGYQGHCRLWNHLAGIHDLGDVDKAPASH